MPAASLPSVSLELLPIPMLHSDVLRIPHTYASAEKIYNEDIIDISHSPELLSILLPPMQLEKLIMPHTFLRLD